MEGKTSSQKKKNIIPNGPNDSRFTDMVFSWSLEDIRNENLYENQVEKIPESFQSVEHYTGSFIFPLLEETRAELCSAMEIISRAPFAEVIIFDKSRPYGTSLYDVKVDYWRNRFSDSGKEPYRTLPGDIFILADAKPESDTDLERLGRTWTFALVNKIPEDESEDDSTSTYFKVKAARDIEVEDGMWKSMFVIFLINITTNKRIWNALHMTGNLKIIKEVLYTHPVVDENCNLCLQNNDIWARKFGAALSSELNESQTNAILASLCKIHCHHKSSVELIWGPPGTGKTKAISSLLVTLLGMNLRILTCAPTNVAITEVASRVLKLLKESFGRDSGIDALLGDILLFGNKDRLKVGSDIEEIYLDYRVRKLIECFAPLTGWKHCFSSMIDLLENCVSQYQIFLENELIKEKECNSEIKGRRVDCKSFLEYVRDRFGCTASPLRSCVLTLCTHLPRSYILEDNFENMIILIHLLDSFGTMLFQDNVVPKEFEDQFSCPKAVEDSSESFSDTSSALYAKRRECLVVLKDLRCSLDKIYLPSAMNERSIMEFCYQRASLIFCTASSSYKLHSVDMEPPNFLVIDEAAQLKECETFIPLKLQGIRRAILFGDECQLPAMVNSNVSAEAGFGRSLFERLSSMGHSKHLLNIQYRMHPSISFFPNSNFYHGKILDAANVKSILYEKHYLRGPMFCPYSFINISDGREEKDDVGHSLKNLIEVAVAMKILHNLHKAWNGSKEKLTVGVISPYAAQVMALQEKLGRKYENTEGFAVKVKSVDGFQGGEEDIIIISTVRSNSGGSIGFISNPQRTNVALTRARHCLWILGNERTLAKNDSVWEALVCDARARNCFFNADEDKDLAKTILEVKKELNQFDDLFNRDSILFRNARWKVLFSDDFRKSFGKLKSLQKKKSIINLLLKLSSGWRPKKRNVDIECESSSQILKQFKVEGLYIVCTVDIVKELRYIQVLRVWDILPLEDIPKLVKRLDGIFGMYTDDFINHCKEKFLERDLEVPKSWVISSYIVRFKNLSNNEPGSPSNAGSFDGRSYVENSKVRESLLLMKFYSLSSGVVNHLLSDREGRELDLPFEVTDEELKIILFNRSSFILGRSGTGKTTVLTMKLFQKEQHHHLATEGFYGVNRNTSMNVSRINEVGKGIEETKESILRQLFVTVSPKLCYAVKQHVSHLKSFALGFNSSAGSSSIDIDDIDDTAQFTDIPDTLVDIPPKSYPLVITFQKFLIMLDGTLGGSYFERFHDVRDLSQGKTGILRSVALQTFIRTKEVNYDRFSSSYWPHFNAQLTKKLDSSRVFTEIMSHIKGGLPAGESHDGKLNREDYVLLSEGRTSTLSKQKREIIYDIFQDYEKLKIENGEFDLADLVIDLHRRLRDGYVGDEMDFVYIDEVQDLTMRQIALFKYVCRNVSEGFVFSGDTAQTISRGIDFRFQDIRSLFYNEFMLGSRGDGNDGKKEKGQISEIFNLSQNFRTHAGVLKLAQSVIDLLYRFFPQSVDVLKPETSLIYGEAPVLLESGNDDNAIVTIFGNGGNVGGNIVGFGAEQVILVRDDCARNKILDYVGKQALVLTIVECKGLEFQDVLLYNFFGSSPLKNQWRVIYEYMKEQNLLDTSFPSFDKTKHNVLCSELKQLYVAITRTRQRLWICENKEELSKPMFDYWKKLCIVQVRQLDESLAQEMQVASSSEEWKSRGMKLLQENNYVMATMCFERAGDTYWENFSKAVSLKASADRMHSLNPEKACIDRRQAAEIFESIGRADKAAECFFQLEEYERAGKLYLEKCGESKLAMAGDCFCRAECYELAANVYAKGNFFSECLSVCARGKLFDMGLKYIQYWKQHATTDKGMVERSTEIDRIEQDLLESCARHYHELKDNRVMMDFVRAFHSMDKKRNFLKTLGCLNELLSLEIESGNYLEAADIAKLRGNLLLAANLYAKGNLFSECLSVCARGKLFDMGLKYIQYWKQHATTDKSMVEKSTEIDRIEQDFLESCARHYHELKDNRVMMDFVRAFHSMDKKRNFLKTLGCLDELLPLEIESGNYLEAADIAKLRGNLLLEAELLAKAGRYKEASELILWCVFSNSLWSPGSKGWPLKQFPQKEELLTKAKAYAKNVSELFYDTVCTEADVLSNKQSSLLELRQYLSASQRHESLRGEILSARKIIDAHIHSNTSKYEWEDGLVVDLMKHSEDRISQNHVSVETLVYYWNFWKDKIVNILKCLECLETQDDEEYRSYGKFCLNYFGVWKPFNNLNTVYSLLIPDANWVKEVNNIFLRRNGELISIDVRKIVSVARGYWCSELLSVGISVLENLEALFKFSSKNSLAMFCQSMPLIHIFDVTTFLLESKFLERRYSNNETLQKFLELPTDNFFGYVFPLDWRKSLTENMICLRGTDLSQNLLKKVIFEIVSPKNYMTYGRIGRVVMMILGSCKPSRELYEKIAKSFSGKPLWKAFFENLCGNIGSESQVSAPSNSNAESGAGPLVFNFLGALEDTFNVNWRYENDYISPFCFLYLVERLLILVFYYQGCFFTTKSSFVEWLFYQEWDTNPTSNLTADIPFILGRMARIVERFLYGTTDTIDWIKESNVNLNYYPLLVLRLVVILCLICVNSGIYDLLFRLLHRSYITSILPREFFRALRRIQRYNDLSVNVKIIAEAFKKIENPLVMASMGKHHTEFLCSDSIFVDMKVNQCREDILRVLFPKKVQASQCHKGAVDLATTDSCSRLASNSNNQENKIPKQHPSSNFVSTAEQEDSNTQIETEGNPQMTCRNFWEIFNASKSVVKDKEVNLRCIVPDFPVIKVEIEKYIRLITPAVTQSSQKNFFDGEDANLFEEATGILDKLRQLYAAMDVSEQELENNLSKIGELFKRVQLRRPRLESFLDQLSEASIAVGSQNDKEGSNIKAEENSESDKGKMKASEANVADKTSTSKNRESGSNRGKGNNKNKKEKKGKGRKKYRVIRSLQSFKLAFIIQKRFSFSFHVNYK